jgi:hypothetical protein
MATTDSLRKVNIRPGVSILSVLRHLNYKPWFAMAEFVDNAIQSAISRHKQLESVEKEKGYKLRVDIELTTTDSGRIRIADNAAGISKKDYVRAFRPAEIPPDANGLSEFGMGMKSAACWFSPSWTVRTTALGEDVERKVSFDIKKIVHDDIQELDVQTSKTLPNSHYTEIILKNLFKVPHGNTVNKMKEHLASIYRVFLRDDFLELYFDGEKLVYEDPKILVAPYYKTPKATPKVWRKDIKFSFGGGIKVKGFAAIRETGNTSSAGLALFRRNRLIIGSADEGYRPEFVFGKPNSYRYQRIFGEFHLDGVEVSHTKDGFKWEEYEEEFLKKLKQELNKAPLPLLEQAEEHRVRITKKDLERGAERAVARTAQAIQSGGPDVLGNQLSGRSGSDRLPEALPSSVFASTREIDVDLKGKKWKIVLELSADPSIEDWITLSDKTPDTKKKNKKEPARRQITVRLALDHPFMERFGGVSQDQIEPLLRVAAAIGLAEITARESGVRLAGEIRRNINELLRDALSKP